MKKYLYSYIDYVDNRINNNDITEDFIKEHLIKIGFFQHERLIHLLVTLAYAIMFVISMVAALNNILFCFIGLIFTGFLIPYVVYYFNLEKRVQYLYKQYDMMRGNK